MVKDSSCLARENISVQCRKHHFPGHKLPGFYEFVVECLKGFHGMAGMADQDPAAIENRL